MSEAKSDAKKKSDAPKRTGPAVHAEDVKAFLARVAVSSVDGLSDEEAAKRLEKHGKNKLPEPAKKSALLRILDQFANPLVLTLLAAAVIAVVVAFTTEAAKLGYLARFGDATAILLIVILNAFLGYYQERRAEAALDALQKLSAPSARVRRGGKLVMLSAEDVVPGDLLEIEAGDAVAADARLVQTIDIATEEAALTGRARRIQKDALAFVADDAPLADRVTMIFTGTTIVRGKGARW
ncbi:MAG: cation-transporting P-type ATPase [Polyangiaceae bacterium]